MTINTRNPTDSTKAGALREAFDRSFAEAHVGHVARGTPALAIRIGGGGGGGGASNNQREGEVQHRWVLPLEAISSVTKKRKIAFVPGGPEGQVGLSGIQGQLTAVYSLATLLKYRATSESETILWLALVRSGDLSIALGFEALDAQVFLTDEDRAAKVVRIVNEEVPRPVVDVPALLQTIRSNQ